jgi:glycosyltransferase involved in cell wall biosynthesis
MSILSIIIPVFNEDKTVYQILDKVKETQLTGVPNKEIIIVNDGSTDNTELQILKFTENNTSVNIKYIKHNQNYGKGAAVKTGISEVTGQYCIIQDADLEYDPADYNALLQPMLDGFADVVYGSRFLSGNPHRILFFWNSSSNWVLTLISNILTNLNLSDTQACYKLFKTEIFKSIELKEKGFGFESEITAKISRVPKIRIYEVGISYYGRTYEEGKKIRFKDAVRSLYSIIKYNLFSK